LPLRGRRRSSASPRACPLASHAPRLTSWPASQSFRNRRALGVALSISACVWLANLVLYVAVGGGLGLGAGLGGYLALEGVGNLALAVPGTAAGIGSFDYLTLLTARSLAVPEEAAAAYVLAVHALTVVPVTVLGLLLLGRAVPARSRVPAVEPA
jgi:uncharacterized membrane protein YbhN (UPF0104 family)